MIELARGIAFAAHAGQKPDRDGRPHIDHVARVVLGVEEIFEPRLAITAESRQLALSAAWLHDVVEDTPVSPELMARAGVDAIVIEVVRLLTRSPEEAATYMEYIEAIADAPGVPGSLARIVKLADLRDNAERCTVEGNTSLLRRYLRAQAIVTGVDA